MNPEQALDDLEKRGLMRQLRTLPENRGKISINGVEWLNFSSNDYLDLAQDKALKDASIKATQDLGCGSGGSRLTTGHLTIHENLETAIADYMGTESSLIFGSGFLTNLGVIPALAGDHAAIFCDRLNHASLIDGALMAGVKWHRYRHNDVGHLDDLLTKHPAKDGQTRLVITDSVFSMDGDIAPLKDIADCAKRHDALLMVDESHAVGVLGPKGAGMCKALGLEPDVITCGMGKSFGSYGGYVACSHVLRSLIINRARSFIYSTGLPPACIAASHAALDLFIARGDELCADLMDRARHMHSLLENAGFTMLPFESPILPIMVGDNHKTTEFAEKLAENNIICSAIRPPTVPPGTSRLRLTVTRAHDADDLNKAVKILADIGRQLGILE